MRHAIPGTLGLPFVYRATVRATVGGRKRSIDEGFLDLVPILPVEVATGDLSLAIRVERLFGQNDRRDEVLSRDGKLYHRLETGGLPIAAAVLHREPSEAERRAIGEAVSRMPRPAGSMAPRYGIHHHWGPATLEETARRGGWTIAGVALSDHEARWNEASIHYHDAILTTGEALYLRCGEPVLRYSHRHVGYGETRYPAGAHDQFGLDRIDELRRFVQETTHLRWSEIVVDPIVSRFDRVSDDLALLIDLGRQLMDFVPHFRKATTVADRRARGCEEALADLEALYLRHGEFDGNDARLAIDAVGELGSKLFPVIRPRWLAGAIASQASRARVRLEYLDDRSNELSPEDRDALSMG